MFISGMVLGYAGTLKTGLTLDQIQLYAFTFVLIFCLLNFALFIDRCTEEKIKFSYILVVCLTVI